MKTRYLTGRAISIGLLTLAMAGWVAAEDANPAPEGKDESMLPGLHGEVHVTGQGISGLNQSAKLEEYRDLSQYGSADWIKLDFENKAQTSWFDLDVKDAIGGEDGVQDDMTLRLRGGQYGKWKSEFEMNRIPHRFLEDVGTLYSGVGTTEMRIPDATQAALQVTSTNTVARASLLNALYGQAGTVNEIGLQRDRYRLKFEWVALDPVTIGMELTHEERYGDRPIGGGFPRSQAIQLVEPIDYGTTGVNVWAAYDKDKLHLKLEYAFSYFENRAGSLSFDNPFVNVSHAATPALPVPNPTGLALNTSRVGRIDLWPDNLAHNVTLSMGYDLPAQTRLTASAGYGWWEQDDKFYAYTVNTSLVTGSGTGANVLPFNAFDPANLPQSSLNGSVETQKYALGLTNRAIDKVEIRARYRAYNRDNQSDQIEFPGEVVSDNNWTTGEEKNIPLSYFQQNGGLEVSYDLPMNHTLTLGYLFNNMDRMYTREVADMWEHTLRATLDANPSNVFQGRVTYEHTWRVDSHYDANASFGGEREVLPFLQKYDEAEKQRDKLTAQFTFFSDSIVTPTVGYTLLWDDYDTNFGLTEEIRHAANFGLDSTPFDRLTLHGDVTWEWSDQDQGNRQWSSNGAQVGDPFTTEPNEFSLSNWSATTFDRSLTVNFRSVLTLIKDKLGWENTLTYSGARENIALDSPLGAGADNITRDISLFGLSHADDSNRYTLRTQFRWKVRNNLTIVLGYLYEEFDHKTMGSDSLVPVAVNPTTGAYLSYLGLAFDDPDYISHTGFLSLEWKF